MIIFDFLPLFPYPTLPAKTLVTPLGGFMPYTDNWFLEERILTWIISICTRGGIASPIYMRIFPRTIMFSPWSGRRMPLGQNIRSTAFVLQVLIGWLVGRLLGKSVISSFS